MRYEITPKGWSESYTPKLYPDGTLDESPLDDLLLTLTKMGKNALIWTGKEWVFESVVWRKNVNKTIKSKRK